MRQVIGFLLAIQITISTASSIGATPNQDNYRVYHNARFAYSISYPVDILVPQGESDNGDGQKFRSKDGRTEMIVYGSYQVEKETLRKLYQAEVSAPPTDRPKRVVTYQRLGGNWFVISGRENGRVFYQKTILKREKGAGSQIFITFRIEYDEAQKGAFDPITAKIARSFKG